MFKARGMVVTGTDTGVGKTVVAAALLSLLRAAGVDAVPMKLVQTGCPGRAGALRAPDLDFCLAAAGLEPTGEDFELMAPIRLPEACSPHLAARLAGVRLSLQDILRPFRALAARHAVVVAEGAGGLLVPLNSRKTMLDLMRGLALPVVLVARAGLGTINHTLLSLRELERAGLPVLGVVFNDARPAEDSRIAADNRRVVRAMGRVPVLGHVPFLGSLEAGRVRPADFRAACARHLPSARAIVGRVDRLCR